MKKSIYIYSLILTGMLSIQSCQLAEELDDYKPMHSLETETAINSQQTAELALVGAYASFGDGALPVMPMIPDIFSGYSTTGRTYAARPEESGFVINDPLATETTRLAPIYRGLYELINRANWIIELVEQLDDDVFEPSSRRQEIIAEANMLRGLGHFYLLRNFGEFYDLDSEYGITVQLEPVKSAEAHPRSSVLETYNAILADLDKGISDGPVLRSKKYTNSTFAKALKAKVLLYMSRFEESAILAQEIIEGVNANFMLEPTYGAIFEDHESSAIFESSEILFGTSGQPNETIGMGNFYSDFFARITPQYINTMESSLDVNGQMIQVGGSQRVEGVFFPLNTGGGYYTTKYTSFFTGGNYEMYYHMRIAEVYLILAEASARANNIVTTEASNALNEIRLRAGATTTGGDGFETYPETIGLEQFLTAVRYEKLAELHAEQGEAWYDLVRYAYIDGGFDSGFMVSDVKPSATNPDKFILPIPTESIDAGGNVVDQNPGYN
ncbi:RagB/SusD family nutrient uptake outer membrane protein [Aestuariibaculum marinum]|uniref:RagB/SusD family nutrient uptake outer membrane protein n=1 Tax=Aestuariibaculum marinum TaxID=2683592 RepID=A0A8J6UDC9_9FLAO|nr:RagB/SusD family nutrient uptake outer membrane protein [Aestuariibaculum marinum]MBD0825478.1 RagB/SusD family nutrient uptake outer membrane protein [Aestuariibaculum marinum]